MDSFLGKFRLYDFMGIWGPGAITVTYFMFTLYDVIFKCFSFFPIVNPGISKTYLLLILYTVIAYVIGVILHEIGRTLADVTQTFHASHIIKNVESKIFKKQRTTKASNCIRKPAQDVTEDENDELSLRPKCRLAILSKIRWDFYQKITTIMPSQAQRPEFNKVISQIKYNPAISSERVDHYHAIYALARSLCIMFIIHAVFSFLGTIMNIGTVYCKYICCDIVLATLFYIRTYRYFYSWIENIYTQYYITNSQTMVEYQTAQSDIHS